MIDPEKIKGVIAYAIVKSEDGSLVKKKGDAPFLLDEIVAFMGSGGEVIRDTLGLGDIKYLHIKYQGHPVIIIPENDAYLGLLCEPSIRPETILASEEAIEEEKVEEVVEKVVEKKEEVVEERVELPKPLQAKLKQINSIFIEFSAEGKKAYWRELLKKGVDLLSQELASHIKVTEGGLDFVTVPSEDQVDECSSALRSVIDFLVKKAVEEFGPSKARMKVQRVIESLR
ncbi:MAG TPA: roadblock/LC7 domain-containing protein [bacterium (Candidatus Stahlbacteria)]|nr:roadblock/LC7 domain-containing protein [Candidatus Stahlbacteria bacterium]